jgi:dienelactone hydrolase
VTWRYTRTGGYTPSEEHITMLGSGYSVGDAGRVIVYAHGAGGNGAVLQADVRADLERYADRGYVVSAPFLGGAAPWGNPACVDAIDALLVYLHDTYGADVTRPMFIGDSHGGPCVLNWAVYNAAGPARLGAAVLRVPAIAMQQMHDTNVAGVAAGMEAAYTNLAGLVAAYPTRDPSNPEHAVRIAASGIATRCRLDYNETDPFVRAADVRRFSALSGIEARVLGGPSHDPWAYVNVSDQLAWLRSRG